VPEPQFEGQTKTKLGNSDVSGWWMPPCRACWWPSSKKIPRSQAIINKVILAAQARAAARKARELVQRKSVLSGGGLPGKLADCSDRDPDRCELFSSKVIRPAERQQGRDRSFQASSAAW